MTGTWLNVPALIDAPTVLVRTKWSTVGAELPPVCLARIVLTGRLRRQAAV
jgi:hypothetical protein